MDHGINDVHKSIRRCKQCRRCHSRNQAVPGEGNAAATILLLGEAPGKKENQSGRPFVGRAGSYLNKILPQYHVKRESLFITSILKCYHPDSPLDEEMKICKPWTEQQIDIINPKKILVMGKSAQKGLLQLDNKLTRVRRDIWKGIPCVITCHPAAAMRFPQRDEQFKHGISLLLSL